MSATKQLALFGTGGHALSVVDILYSNSYSGKFYFVEEHKSIDLYMGYNVYPRVRNSFDPMFIAIGNNQLRKDLFVQYSDREYLSIISSRSTISHLAGTGRHIFAGHHVHIGPGAFIGDNTIVNTGAIIEHECQIGQHCHISINASIAGQVSIGDNVFIGAGASIINNISICSDVVIGAGSVVITSIHEPGTYVGVPAKKVSNSSAV